MRNIVAVAPPALDNRYVTSKKKEIVKLNQRTEIEECKRNILCSLDSCHKDCQQNTNNRKCKHDASKYDGQFTFGGTCVECMAHNQCPGQETSCDFTTNTCTTAGKPNLREYTTSKDAETSIFKPLERIGDAIAAVQTSGASVAEIFANTR